MLSVLYMTVSHADFIYITLERLRRRLHIAIKDLLFCFVRYDSTIVLVKNRLFLSPYWLLAKT